MVDLSGMGSRMCVRSFLTVRCVGHFSIRVTITNVVVIWDPSQVKKLHKHIKLVNKYERYYGPGRWHHLVKNLRWQICW